MKTTPSNAPSGAGGLVDDAGPDHEAFDRTAPLRNALEVADTPSYTLDAMYAAGVAFRIVARVMPYRDDLRALPKYDIGHLDRFEDQARALRFVHVEIQRQLQRQLRRPGRLPALAGEGWRMRRMMLSFAEALSHKGLFAPELIERLRGGAGYRRLSQDLIVLVAALGDLPEGQAGPVTRADLSRAAEIANTLGVHFGKGEDPDPRRQELFDERQKLGSLLSTAHGQIRRGIAFLRWDEGDVDELVPSLYVPPGVRGRRRTKATTESPATSS